MKRADLSFQNHGTVWLLFAPTRRGKAWRKYNIDATAQFFGDSVVVEPRYVENIVIGARADGLRVEAA